MRRAMVVLGVHSDFDSVVTTGRIRPTRNSLSSGSAGTDAGVNPFGISKLISVMVGG